MGSMTTMPEAAPDRMRLASMLSEARSKTGLGLADAAKSIGVTEQWLRDVEAGWGVLASAELKDACAMLDLSYEEALEAAQGWNKSIWEAPGKKLRLEPVSAEARALKDPDANDLQREVIRLADDLAFVANVARELSVRAEKAALRARETLSMSGVPVPVDDDPVATHCVACGERLFLGRDLVVSLNGSHAFCNADCGNRWLASSMELP